MEAEYRHTQYGILMGVVFLVTGALIVYAALEIIAESRWESAVLMICLYILGVVSFHSFTIEVSEEKLKFRFGIGIIQKSYGCVSFELKGSNSQRQSWISGSVLRRERLCNVRLRNGLRDQGLSFGGLQVERE